MVSKVVQYLVFGVCGVFVLGEGAMAADAAGLSEQWQPEQLQRTVAIQDIEMLRRHYARATDQLGVNTVASVKAGTATYRRIFSPDVAVRVTGEGMQPLSATGPDAWAKVANEALADFAATQHLIGSQIVEFNALEFDAEGMLVSGDASMSSYLQAWHATPQDTVWLFIGTYYDKVRFTPGVGWQIYDMTLERVSGEDRPLGKLGEEVAD